MLQHVVACVKPFAWQGILPRGYHPPRPAPWHPAPAPGPAPGPAAAVGDAGDAAVGARVVASAAATDEPAAAAAVGVVGVSALAAAFVHVVAAAVAACAAEASPEAPALKVTRRLARVSHLLPCLCVMLPCFVAVVMYGHCWQAVWQGQTLLEGVRLMTGLACVQHIYIFQINSMCCVTVLTVVPRQRGNTM